MLDVESSNSFLSRLSPLLSAQALHPSGRLTGKKEGSFGADKIESTPEIKISRVLSLSLSMKTFHFSDHLTFFGLGDPISSHPIPLGVGRVHH